MRRLRGSWRHLLWGEGVEQLADRSKDSFDRARCGAAQQVLELGEDLV